MTRMSNVAAVALWALWTQFAADGAVDITECEEPPTETTDDSLKAADMTHNHFFASGQYFEHAAVFAAARALTENTHIGDALGTVV